MATAGPDPDTIASLLDRLRAAAATVPLPERAASAPDLGLFSRCLSLLAAARREFLDHVRQEYLVEACTTVEAELHKLDSAITRHRNAQEARVPLFRDRIGNQDSASQQAMYDARDRITSQLDAAYQKVEFLGQQITATVQLIDLAAFADTIRRIEDAEIEQKRSADRFRWISVAALGLAVILVPVAAWLTRAWPSTAQIPVHLAIVGGLGALARMSHRHSAEHRKEENRCRQQRLGIMSQRVFLPELSPETREQLTLELARHLRQQRTDDDGGPSNIGRILPHGILPGLQRATDSAQSRSARQTGDSSVN